MESDERFKHLATDPRFKTLRKKQRKVQIDERFQSMFTDEKFSLKYSKDKRGRRQKKTSGDDLKRYYSLEGDLGDKTKKPEKAENKTKTADVDSAKESSCDEDENKLGEQTDEEEENVSSVEDEEIESTQDEENDEEDEENVDEEEEESASELSSSSDESESELDDDVADELDAQRVEYDWKPLDHDAETAETTTRRLAIQNLDWDHLDVKDIYTLVHSVRPPKSVKIYVSEFGKERLKREELEGPKELVDMPQIDEVEEEYNQLRDKMRALNNPEPTSYKVNEYEDADEAVDPKNDEIRERIRAYQLNRMRYYYAVVEFDSVESAEIVYKELDGMEYEGSSLELDLRFIPDDIKFDDEDIKAVCDRTPDLTNYKAPNFINTALQQTTTKFTWDETDIKRQEKLRKAYTKEELEKDDLEAYLASESDSEDEDEDEDQENDSVSVVTGNSEARINKYKLLLKSLDEEAEKKKKVDVDVEWENSSVEEDDDDDEDSDEGEGSDEDRVDLEESSEQGEEEEELEEEEEEEDEEEVEKVASARLRKRKGKTNKRKAPTSRSAEEKHEDDELDLLMMDADPKLNDFKFNPDDERFRAVYESGRYNIDPSHPNFKRTQAFDIIAKKKREKRQKTSL